MSDPDTLHRVAKAIAKTVCEHAYPEEPGVAALLASQTWADFMPEAQAAIDAILAGASTAH